MAEGIGHAVVNFQYLEIAFALCVELVFKQAEAQQFDEIEPLVPNFTKPPVRALLQKLSHYTEVDRNFQSQFEDLIARRNVLVHRWVLLHGWPDPANDEKCAELMAFSASVSRDANAFTRVLVKLIHDYLGRFTEFRTSLHSLATDWLSSLPVEFGDLKLTKDQTQTC